MNNINKISDNTTEIFWNEIYANEDEIKVLEFNEEERKKSPIVLVPGNPIAIQHMIKISRYLAKNTLRNTIAFQYPKIKKSPVYERPQALDTLLAEKNIQNAHLVTHSYGSIAAMRAANNLNNVRDRIKSIISINGIGNVGGCTISEYVKSFLRHIKSASFNKELSAEERKFTKRWFLYNCFQNPIAAIKETKDKDLLKIDINQYLPKLEKSGISFIDVRSKNDTLLPIDKMSKKPDHILENGDHNGILANPDMNGGKEIIEIIKQLEL